MEMVIMQLIVNSGDARSRAMEAIRTAKNGNIEKAKEKIAECEEALIKAHQQQTQLIQDEAKGNKTEVSLLLVHAQDHLMNAITVKDMAKEFIDLYEKLNGKGK
ncbi:MAG: phosphotransferase system lactose/cellobiose-specific subunit [Firmicutes bacterium]|nr:phosphotransferase system lactose/cellobiose-specific subunit [Bacillota bacterium]